MAIAEIPALLASEEVEHGFELLYRRYAGDVLGYSRSVVDDCARARKLIGATRDLTDEERSNLRGHLRACAECASLERKERGLRSVLARVASLLPLPSWFSSFFGGVAAKTAATVAVAAVA